MNMRFAAPALALIVSYIATAAGAVPVIYIDRAAFNAAAGTTTFESFEDSRPSAPSQTKGLITLTETNSITNSVYFDNTAGATDGVQSANIVDNDSSLFTISFSQTTFALGFDFVSADSTTIGITGAVTSSRMVTAGGSAFFGVIDTAGFSSLTFDASGSPNYGVDSLAYRTASIGAAAVPEPATWAMMIAGFGFVGSTMRHRRKSVHFA